MGVPGVSSNTQEGSIGTDVNRPPAITNRDSRVFQKHDQTKNYEIGKVISRKVMPFATLRRVSAAVIVDGSYAPVATKRKKADPQMQYVARRPEEMQQFERIVKRAINFSEARGDAVEIQNIPFETAQVEAAPETPQTGGWGATLKRFNFVFDFLLAGLFIIMSFLFLVRPLIRWLTAETPSSGEIIRQLPKTVGELEGEYGSGSKQLTFTDQASQLVANDNEASVGVMRDWLKEN